MYKEQIQKPEMKLMGLLLRTNNATEQDFINVSSGLKRSAELSSRMLQALARSALESVNAGIQKNSTGSRY